MKVDFFPFSFILMWELDSGLILFKNKFSTEIVILSCSQNIHYLNSCSTCTYSHILITGDQRNFFISLFFPHPCPGFWSCNHIISDLWQVLVTNCKHGKGPSLEVLLDVELGVVLFHLAYKFRVAANAVESSLQVAVPYTVSVSASSVTH